MEKLKNLDLTSENLKRVRQKLWQNRSDNSKIDSPLAKYDVRGNIICIICRSVIKSSVLWKVHVNSKQHKLKVEAAKQLRLKPNPVHPSSEKVNNLSSDIPLKHNGNKTVSIELSEKTKNHTKNIYRVGKFKNDSRDDTLPEKFFDDPITANIQKAEYKICQDEEWEKFQREIKEESSTSNAIIAGEQLESTVIRQIEEIDEQMERWVKVRILEQKMECIVKNSQSDAKNQKISTEISSDEEEEKSFDEFSDWRSKKF